MSIKRNFAQSIPKSPAKRQLELIGNPSQVIKKSNLTNHIQCANHLLQKTIVKIDGAYAPSTIRAYRANFERFISFCRDISAPALPSDSETVAKYIQTLTKSGLKSASIRLAIASISTIHKLNQLPDPTQLPAAKLELRRMHRTLGRASKQAFGITEPILRKMLLAVENNPRGYRDRALLLLAYDSLCRRGELTSIRLEDIEFNNAGFPLLLKIQKSKTDQEASGKIIRLSDATSKAIKDWIESVQLIEGYLFRGLKNNSDILAEIKPSQINRIYKKLASRANLPDDQIKNISGHSFRVGGAQDLLASGATLPLIMVKGRWSKPDTAMRYVEYVDPYVNIA